MNNLDSMKLLKNGLVYDGTGADAFKADILIEGDKILKVENTIEPEDGWEVVDIDGLSVSSGFIDAHSHNDWFAVKKEPLKYFDPFIRQGITTFITGNCGLSAVGFETDTPYVDKVGAGLFNYQDTTGVYPSVSEFFDVSPGLYGESVSDGTCHLSDCIRHSISPSAKRELQEFREAIIYRRILNAMILNTCVGHIKTNIILRKFTDYFRRTVRSHIHPTLEIAHLAEVKICIQT